MDLHVQDGGWGKKVEACYWQDGSLKSVARPVLTTAEGKSNSAISSHMKLFKPLKRVYKGCFYSWQINIRDAS